LVFAANKDGSKSKVGKLLFVNWSTNLIL
jgi:hypothetical protein